MDENETLQLCLERDRLLSDPEFSRSPTMCILLRYLVDHKLSGNETPIKAYTIAVEALGRDESFETEIDSYPRVQIGRLRRMLDNFYLREGGENRLSIPQGRYEIILEANEQRQDNDSELIGMSVDASLKSDDVSQESDQRIIDKLSSQNTVRNIILIVVMLLVTGGIAYFLWPSKSDGVIAYPVIIVEPIAPSTSNDPLETAQIIENHLIKALEPFEQVRLFNEQPDNPEVSSYRLKSTVFETTAPHIQMELIDGITKEIIWSTEIKAENNDQLDMALDRAVVAVAGSYGAIAQTELSKRSDDFSAGYPCLLQFDQYLRYRDDDIRDRVLQCMEKSVKRFPNDAHLVSAWAFTRNLSWGTQGKRKNSVSGTELAQRAEALDHDSATANFAMAQSAFFEGDCQKGVAWGKQAVELNPLNSRVQGYLGLYMLGCRIPEGEDYARRALDLDPQADLAIAATLAFQMLKRGDAIGAKTLTVKYMTSAPRIEPGLELTFVLSSAKLGERKEARRAWKKLAARFGMPEEAPPREVLSKWIANPLLVHEIGLVFDEIKLY